MSHTYDHPRPAVTVDAVLLSEGHVLLIRRRDPPFQNQWALPGGFLDENEAPADGAARELAEETTLANISLHPLGFWGNPGRDPRGHTISLVYRAIVDRQTLDPKPADDAAELAWHSVDKLPALAFDHADIIAEARSSP